MKKIEVCRASGMPIRMEYIKLWRQDFKEEYDRVELKHTKSVPGKQKVVDMVSLSKELESFEESLKVKYPVTDAWDMLTTKKAWKEKLTEYGTIAMTKHGNGKDIVYVIMDVEMEAVTYSDIAV